MARENRAKREERRFGKARLLIEMLIERDWNIPHDLAPYGAAIHPILNTAFAKLKDYLEKCAIVEARNICDFVIHESSPDGKFAKGVDVSKELPAFRPPFEFTFIECSVSRQEEYIPPKWGVMIYSERAKGEDATEDVGWMFMLTPSGKLAPVIMFTVTTDDDDNVCHVSPVVYRPADLMQGMSKDELCPMTDRRFRHMCSLLIPALMTVSFMNCKRGVQIGTVEPDAKLNRERTRAGLKPFLRYHTIDIDGMKQVLRTEGGLEANGLKKALHLCRGHFATYTDSFMGRPLAEPMTIWRPQHVRGSAKQGVVVSDYNVHPPQTGSAQ